MIATRTVRVTWRNGVHARPAAEMVKLAATFISDIQIARSDGGPAADAKDIMDIMMLAIAEGTNIVIRAAGLDAEDAAIALHQLVRADFDMYHWSKPDAKGRSVHHPSGRVYREPPPPCDPQE
jgi:phosphotransferase system HPr (HPr) family protein